MASKNLRQVLEAEDLSDCTDLLLKAGLRSTDDLRDVSDAELQSIGIEKFFHRKALLRLGQQSGGGPATVPIRPTIPEKSPAAAAPAAAGNTSMNNSSANNAAGYGDHIRVEVLGARGASSELNERDYYVKVSICDNIDHEVYPVDGTTQRTSKSRGPVPVWAASEKNVLKVKTSFRAHSLAFELKENRLLGENRHCGMLIFPMSKFHRFTDGYVEDTWFPLRADVDQNSEVTATLRVRMTVPGGCPKMNGVAYHVTSVVMKERKLRITVFDAIIKLTTTEEPGSPRAEDTASLPSTYVTLHLDGAPEVADAHIKSKTRVCKHSLEPTFDETFEYFAEAGKCKLLTVKLKEDRGVFSSPVIGQVRIPIQYYMAQREPSEVDDAFPAVDDNGIERARVHLRLRVLAKDAVDEVAPKARSFRRVDSLPSEQEPVNVDNHPAFSPIRSRRGASQSGSRSVSPAEMEALQPKYVSDTDEEDEEFSRAMAAAAKRNQEAAAGQFGRRNSLTDGI